MHGLVPGVTLVEAQPSRVFWVSKSIPVDAIKLFLSSTTTPNKIPLGFIYELMNLLRYLDVLHYVGRDTIKSGIGENSSTSHIKESDFPPGQPLLHVIQDELEITPSRAYYEK